MAALTITAANVAYSDVTPVRKTVQYGEAVTQGEPLRKHTDDKYYLCNHTTATDADASALAITPGAADDYGEVALATSKVIIGATVAVGTSYYIGPTDGEIVPFADLGTGDFPTTVGYGVSTTEIILTFNVVGVAIA